MAVSMVQIVCSFCSKTANKPVGEVRRSTKLGRPLFCSRTCSAQASNARNKSLEIRRACALCGETFTTSTHNKKVNQRFCSRSCASKGSMSDERRAAQSLGGHQSSGNLLSPEETLRRREAWKYAAIEAKLREDKREFEFEYRIGSFIFDLALLDNRVLVEFDGPYHGYQQDYDKGKDQAAKEAGFTVQRVSTPVTVVIDPAALRGL